MAEPPAKRQRLSTSAAYDDVPGIAEKRRTNDLRLKSRFEAIFDKYDRDFTGIGDVIDLQTGEIVVDNGHLGRMRHERDLGVDVVRPKPRIASKNTRKSTLALEAGTASEHAQDDDDELSLVARRDLLEPAEDVPTILPAEGQWARPEELNDPPVHASLALPVAESPADIADRVVSHAAPEGQQLNLLNPAHLARFTANIVQEVVQALQGHRPIPPRQDLSATRASLLTPPASERAGPIKPFASVWGELGPDSSDDEEDEEDSGSESRQDVSRSTDTMQRRERRAFTKEEDDRLLKLRDQEDSEWSVIASELGRTGGTVQRRYNILKNKTTTTTSRNKASQPPRPREKDKSRRATIQLPAQPASAKNARISQTPITASTVSKRRTRHSLPSNTATVDEQKVAMTENTRRSVRLSGLTAPEPVEQEEPSLKTSRTQIVTEQKHPSRSTAKVSTLSNGTRSELTTLEQAPNPWLERTKPRSESLSRETLENTARPSRKTDAVLISETNVVERLPSQRPQQVTHSPVTTSAPNSKTAAPSDPLGRLRRVSQRLSQADIAPTMDAPTSRPGHSAKAQDPTPAVRPGEATTRRTRVSTTVTTEPTADKSAASSAVATSPEHPRSTSTTTKGLKHIDRQSTRDEKDLSTTNLRRRTSTRTTANAPVSGFAAPARPAAKTTGAGPPSIGRVALPNHVPSPVAPRPATAPTVSPANLRIKSSPKSPPTVLGPSPTTKATPVTITRHVPQDDLGSEDELGF